MQTRHKTQDTRHKTQDTRQFCKYFKKVNYSFVLISIIFVFTTSGCSDLIYPIFKVGSIGPGGGYVFYDKGNNRGGWRYLEAAPENIPGTHRWASPEMEETLIPGIGTAIGTGKNNTALILAADPAAQAALACVNLGAGWFLPSKDELNLMYTNLCLKDLGGFADNWYWSSSQGGNNVAWEQNFDTGMPDRRFKFGTIPNVRAIRAF